MKPHPCPICKQLATWEGNPWRPFCSERCKMIDLGKWATGEYFVPGEPVKPEEEASDDAAVKDEDDIAH